MSYADAKDRLEAHRKAVEVAQQLLESADAPNVMAQEREYSIGQALYQLQEYAAASEHLLASHKLEERAETAARLAVCHWRMNDLGAAKQWILQALRLDPKGSITTLIARTKPTFLALLAQFHLSAGEVDEAAASARAALKLVQDDVTALYVLATTQLVAGGAQEALGTFDRAIDAAPPFLAKRIAGEQRAARSLQEANVRLQPFVTSIEAIARIIV